MVPFISQAFQVSLPQELWVMKSVGEWTLAHFSTFSCLLLPLSCRCCFALVHLGVVQIFIASKIFLKDSFLCRSQRLPAWCSRDGFCTLLTFKCLFSLLLTSLFLHSSLIRPKTNKQTNNEPCLEAPKISEMHLYFPCEAVCCEEKLNINVNLFSYTETDGIKGDVHGPRRVPSPSTLRPLPLVATRGRRSLIFLTFKKQQRRECKINKITNQDWQQQPHTKKSPNHAHCVHVFTQFVE